jgi:hypothetical protein
LALAKFMRLSLLKAAHVDVGGAPYRKSGYGPGSDLQFISFAIALIFSRPRGTEF